MDRVIPHLHLGTQEAEGPKTSLKKTTMLVLAVTLHNIPEGMAVGVVFAGMLSGSTEITVAGAFSLAIGIAIQNFPEGAIISMPLKSEGQMSRKKAFLYGTLSGVVEPVGAAADHRTRQRGRSAFTVSVIICGGRDALCCRRRADSGSLGGRAFESGNGWICGRICTDDGAGCGAGIKGCPRQQRILVLCCRGQLFMTIECTLCEAVLLVRSEENASYEIKTLAWIALQRNGRMSLARPAAGGESCFAGFFFTQLPGARYNRASDNRKDNARARNHTERCRLL